MIRSIPVLILMSLLLIGDFSLGTALPRPWSPCYAGAGGPRYLTGGWQTEASAVPAQLAAASPTETPAPKVTEGGAEAKQPPPAPHGASKPVPEQPPERLPAGSPVSFPVDI